MRIDWYVEEKMRCAVVPTIQTLVIIPLEIGHRRAHIHSGLDQYLPDGCPLVWRWLSIGGV